VFDNLERELSAFIWLVCAGDKVLLTRVSKVVLFSVSVNE